MHASGLLLVMPRFDPSPWNLGLPVCALAAACGPVLPLEPMGPTSLGETDPDPASTTDDGASSDDGGCNPPCPPGYYCDGNGLCVSDYGCFEFGCCYDDPCCGEGPCCDNGGYGCSYCYAVTDCGGGSFCEYQMCVPLEILPDCEEPLEMMEIFGATPMEVDGLFSLAFVETDDYYAGRELVIGDEDGAVLIRYPGALRELLPVPNQGLVEDIVGADFDGDGRQDIAISTTAPASLPRLVVLLNSGGGSFSPIELSVSAAFDIAAADLNNDGLPDIVGEMDAGLAYRVLGVLRNTGGLTFTPSFLDIDAEPLDIDVGDLDANGMDDVVSADNTQQQLWYGADPLDSAPDWAVADVPYLEVQVVVGDFDGNGHDDIVRLTNVQGWTLVDAWASSPEGLYEQPEWGVLGETRSATARAGDIDGDGHADLVRLSQSTLHVSFGAPVAGLFRCRSQIELPISPHLIAVGDFDGSGSEDVAVGDATLVHVYAAPAPAPT